MMQNLRQISTVLQTLNTHASDGMLHTIKCYGTLFSNGHHRDHEVHKVECTKEHGCCMAHNKKRGKFARAGSVCSKIGHVNATGESKVRTNGHVNESKKIQEFFFSTVAIQM